MIVGFDFDGTLACWRQGAERQFANAARGMLDAAALFGPTLWARRLHQAGHVVIIVSGRGAIHEAMMLRWCHHFLGFRPQMHLRPSKVGLGCSDQAQWKSEILVNERISVYVGDNPRIDEAAAGRANVAYIDAASLIHGSFPRIGNQPTAKGSASVTDPNGRAGARGAG